MNASGRARRVGFGAALATGLTLMAMSFTGMANLDDDLRAAAEQTPGVERVSVDMREWCDKKPAREQRRRVSDAA